MVFDRLRFIPRWIVAHPLLVVALALALSVLGIWRAMDLRIDSNIVTLLPAEYTSVQAITRLQENVGAETTVDVAIYSPSFEENLAFAEALVPAAMAMTQPEGGDPYFTRVDFRRDVRFVSENALYFATFEELDRLERFLREQAQQVRSATDPLRTPARGRPTPRRPRATGADRVLPQPRLHDARRQVLPDRVPD